MFVHETVHFMLCLIVGFVFVYIYKNWWLIIYSFLAGLFLDADHLTDYFLFRHSFAFNLHEFLSGTYFDASNRVYLFLHGYEYALIFFLTVAILLFNKKRFKNTTTSVAALMVIATSIFLHLVYDEAYYQPRLLTYSITYRASHNFNHDFLEFTVKK